MDDHSLERIEYPLVVAAIARRSRSERGRSVLRTWKPLRDRGALLQECVLLDESMRCSREGGEWCFTGRGDLLDTLASVDPAAPEGTGLRRVLSWLEAGEATRAAWRDSGRRARFPGLGERATGMPDVSRLRDRLAGALDEDGRLRDGASIPLGRLRKELAEGERRLNAQLEKWARAFGSQTYVTRHLDRLVAMVPAAGFPRRRAIVHDVSNSGQSLVVEPLESCGENNRLMETRAAIAEEERRVLAELAGLLLDARPEVEVLEGVLVHLDTLRARALWGMELGAIAIPPGGDRLSLRRARHPLLVLAAARDGKGEAVPLDLELGSPRVAARVLLVSGPNMGGKTVLLKTVGLVVAMSHAALPVPVQEGTSIPEIDRIVTDLGDEQSLDQGLSTFAAHLRSLGEMAALASPRVLLLCDEIGAGTDPEDGAALARALIEHLARAGAWAVVTTHLGSLKRMASEVGGVENGSLEFDRETLTPRYRFLAGIAGASHAIEVATRLGFPEPILERARALRPAEAEVLERLLAELAEAVVASRAEAEALSGERRQVAEGAARVRCEAEALRREQVELRRRLARESETLLARARALWEDVTRQARREDRTRAAAEAVTREIASLESDVDRLGGRETVPEGSQGLPAAEVVVGRRVRLVDLGIEAEVVGGPDREGRVQLRRGSWSIQSHIRRIEPAAGGGGDARSPIGGTWSVASDAAPLELDLRGMDAADAVRALDGGLDRAVLAGLSELRVIHGIGTGVLRAAVERHLRGHPQVAGQRPGELPEGGRGATVARLR